VSRIICVCFGDEIFARVCFIFLSCPFVSILVLLFFYFPEMFCGAKASKHNIISVVHISVNIVHGVHFLFDMLLLLTFLFSQ
jgi:hypothetical protein